MPRILSLLLLVLLFTCLSLAQQPASATRPADAGPKVDEIINETQQRVAGDHVAGIVWWIPVEFWEAAARAQGRKPDGTLDTLRDYTMMVVAVGNVGELGNIKWHNGEEIRKNVELLDASGTAYAPLAMADVNNNAQTMAKVMRPIFVNSLGALGENLEIIYFPAKNKAGQSLADAKNRGTFSLRMKQMGDVDHTFQWNLPLNSLMPPKFCPVGKERVQSNWNFCPWHGVALSEAKK
jgi:hypothetical protein